MIIYTTDAGSGPKYTASLAAARAVAREAHAAGYEYPVEIERCEVVQLTKPNIIDILNSNGGDWCLSAVVVATVHPKVRPET